MKLLIGILEVLQFEIETPVSYGWFHLLSLVIVIGLTALLCCRYRNCGAEFVQKVVFGTAVLVTVLEIYKQIVFSFSVEEGTIVFDFQWYAFPWQFCSTPMYVGLLTGVFKKGKVHDALYAFLATYSVFAGVCVMAYPEQVFISMVGIDVQSMVCHGSMIVIGIWLLATGSVKLEHRTVLKALPVFLTALGLAIAMNELTWYTDLTGGETFNMFFVSRHWPGTLPVYSLIQPLLPYPVSLALYVVTFTLAAYLILLAGMGIRTAVSRRKVAAIA